MKRVSEVSNLRRWVEVGVIGRHSSPFSVLAAGFRYAIMAFDTYQIFTNVVLALNNFKGKIPVNYAFSPIFSNFDRVF